MTGLMTMIYIKLIVRLFADQTSPVLERIHSIVCSS